MGARILEIGASVGTPLALAGFIVAVLYLLYRLVIKQQLTQLLAQQLAKLLDRIAFYLFILALVALVLGVSAYVLVNLIPPSEASAEAVQLEQRARDHLNNGYYPDALKAADRLTKLRPRYATAFLLKGTAHFKLREYSSALGAFQTAAAFERSSPPSDLYLSARYNEGAALAVIGDYGGAQKIFEELVKAEPNDMAVRYNLASVNLLAGDYTAAKTTYELVYKNDPRRKAKAVFGIGLSEMLGTSTPEAQLKGLDHFREAVCIEPNLRGVFLGTVRDDAGGTYEPYLPLLQRLRGTNSYDAFIKGLQEGKTC